MSRYWLSFRPSGCPRQSTACRGCAATRALANRSLTDRSTFSRMPLAAASPGQFDRATRHKNQCIGDGSRLLQRDSAQSGRPAQTARHPGPKTPRHFCVNQIAKDRVTEPILSDRRIVVYTWLEVKSLFGATRKYILAKVQGQKSARKWPSSRGPARKSRKGLRGTEGQARIVCSRTA